MQSMARGKQRELLDCSRPPRSVRGWPLIISPIRDQSLLFSRREGNGQYLRIIYTRERERDRQNEN